MFDRLIFAVSLALAVSIASSAFAFSAPEGTIKSRPDKVVLVFIPGIFGSRLFHTQTGEWHWGEDDYGSLGLSLDEFPDFDVSLLERATVRFRGLLLSDRNVYSDFKLHGQWVAGEVVSFAYDWRKSNRKTAAKFDQWLCQNITKDDRSQIVFVAHSMGGLVLRHWLKDFFEPGRGCNNISSDQINQMIFAGTPHLGSMEPVESLFTGETAFTRERFFSLLFSDNVVRDALTFESTYELLPAYNVIRPECDASNASLSQNVVVYSDTATPIDLQLWNANHWVMLGLPTKLPRRMQRDVVMGIIKARLRVASETVCSLLTHKHSLDIQSKMFFLTGSKSAPGGGNKIPDTLSGIEFRPGGQGHLMTTKDSIGDGTVPTWSSYPSWRQGIRDFASVSAYHDELLSNADAKLTIENILKYAALSAATESGEMFSVEPKDEASLRNALAEFAALDVAFLNSRTFEMAAKQFSEAAASAGIDANNLYDITSQYGGANRSAFRAIGFSAAARDVSLLNKDRQFWANQNSAYALYELGASELAASAAFKAGQTNIIYFGADDPTGPVASPEKFFDHDSKWRSVAARSLEQVGLEPAGATLGIEPIRSISELEQNVPLQLSPIMDSHSEYNFILD